MTPYELYLCLMWVLLMLLLYAGINITISVIRVFQVRKWYEDTPDLPE